MEIKQIIHIFNSSIISGPETLVIPSLNKLNLPVAVIFLSEKRKEATIPSPADYARSHGLTVYEIEVHSRLDIKAILKLRKILLHLKAKIIHSHDVKASTYSLIATFFTKIIRISTHHGIHGRPDFKTKLYERFYSHFILNFFHAVIAVSSSDYKDLQKIGLHQTSCIFNGVTKPIFEIQTKDNIPIIAVIGRLSPEKRCDRILEVASILQKNAPNLAWKLQFFGIGNEEQKLKTLSKNLHLENRVQWMGYKNMIDEMKKLSILMSLSDAEGMPISIIEAGWAGLAIFATAVGGVQDLIPDPSYGISFPKNLSNDEIAALLKNFIENTDSRIQTASHFQNRVKQLFSAEIWIEKHKDLYHSFLSLEV